MDSQLAELRNYLVIGGLLFVIGLIGFLVRRNLIVMFLLCIDSKCTTVHLSLSNLTPHCTQSPFFPYTPACPEGLVVSRGNHREPIPHVLLLDKGLEFP